MKFERGGFAMGLIVGLLVGLALALGVALYVTKVPVPFVNKVPQRTAEQDAAESERNKNWDPNSPLYGKNPARPSSAPGGAVLPPPPRETAVVPAAPASAAAPMARSTRDAAAILGDKPAPAAPVVASTKPGPDPFSYFVQAGAFARTEDAEQQRAKLAMLGFAAKVTEREQSGRTVYRVRVGPFDRKDDADSTKERLDGAGVESSLVRVQK
jgi:cell division protein FtsN